MSNFPQREPEMGLQGDRDIQPGVWLGAGKQIAALQGQPEDRNIAI